MSKIKLIEKLKDRYNLLIIALLVLFSVIIFRLASLTIVEGGELRVQSDTKRLKEIPITASRGNIRDTYGRLMAGNKPSFTVQIMKDELDRDKLNSIALKLIKLLEEEGEYYTDEFPIELNTFIYKNEQFYLDNTETPKERIITIIQSNNLLGDILNTYKTYTSEGDDYSYLTGKKALLVLEDEGIDMPIDIELNQEGKVIFSYDTYKDIDKWKIENTIPMELGPKDTVLYLATREKNIIRKILSHPITRKLTYETLSQRGLVEDIGLQEYTVTYDEDYKNIKRNLMKQVDEITEVKRFDEITMATTAKEDFVTIVMDIEAVVGELFSRTFINSDEEVIVPGKLLLDQFNENNMSLPVELEVDEENQSVIYTYKDERSKASFYTQEDIQGEMLARDAFIYLGKKTGLIDEIITDDTVKGYAQQLMLGFINPKISVYNWEYAPINDKNAWFGQSKNKVPEDSTAKEAFELLREKYEIDDTVTDYEARYIFLVRERIDNQGYLAFQPVTIAYDVNNETVARLSEGKFDLPGVNVAIEPMRYYPMGTTAAHTLGYLGKISQSSEIERYIKGLKYSPNDIIGKTGIEQSFEEYLNGVDGSKKVEVDAFGNTIKVLDKKDAIPGNDMFLSIDAKLQQVAEEALKHALEEIQVSGEFQSKWGNYNYKPDRDGTTYKDATSGALVAIDVKTGKVLAMANYPSYDPNLFATGISTEDWNSLMPEYEEDQLAPRPLFNIALRTAIQPGSTFKMITGLAALENGLNPYEEIYDYGYVDLGDYKPACWLYNTTGGSHGNENLYDAIRDSCNYYFYSLMLGKVDKTNKPLGMKLEIDELLDMARTFGLDEKTGVEIPEEKSGSVPNKENKAEYANNDLRKFLSDPDNRETVKIEGKLTDEEIELIITNAYIWANSEDRLGRGQVKSKLLDLDLNLDINTPLNYKQYDYETEENSIKPLNLLDYITYTYLNEAKFRIGNWLNIAIGQGENAYTPIQMTNYIATLVNGGYKHKVSIIDKVTDYTNKNIVYEPERINERIALDNYDNLEHVKKGMYEVTEPGGTAHYIFRNFPTKVAAKTGTAQNTSINPITKEQYKSYAWFVAFAPYDDPQIAIATVIFQGGHGGFAAPVAREVIAEYLGLNSKPEEFNFTNKMVK